MADAKKKMIEWLTEKGIGEKKVNFKLRDWVFSRQRYWGEPIPMVLLREVRLCAAAGRASYRLMLPDVDHYEPTDNGESPLANDDRLGQHHLPALRRSRKARDRYHAAVGGFILVFPALYATRITIRRWPSKEALEYWMPGRLV